MKSAHRKLTGNREAVQQLQSRAGLVAVSAEDDCADAALSSAVTDQDNALRGLQV